MEPNLDDLFRPKRFTPQQIIVMILLCVLGAWLLWPSSQPKRPPRPAPPPAAAKPKPSAPPLFVTVVPEEETGWCCLEGKVSAATRTACKGSFFAQEEEARKLCPAAPTRPSGSPRGPGKGA